MYDIIFGLLSMSIVYSPILFIAVFVFVLLVQQWVRYVIYNKQYEFYITKKFIMFVQCIDNTIYNGFILMLYFLFFGVYSTFLLFAIFAIIIDKDNSILLYPYVYSAYIAKPAIIIALFLAFTKLCRYSYIKYKNLSDKIDTISNKVV